MPLCRSEEGVPLVHRSALGVPVGFNLNANDVPERDRPLFKKSALPFPEGLVCRESGINETTSLLPETMYCTTRQQGRRRKMERRPKERKKDAGREMKKNAERVKRVVEITSHY